MSHIFVFYDLNVFGGRSQKVKNAFRNQYQREFTTTFHFFLLVHLKLENIENEQYFQIGRVIDCLHEPTFQAVIQ